MRRFGVLCASAILMLSVSACGDDDSNGDNKAGDPATPTSSESIDTSTESPTEGETPTDGGTDLPTESDSPTQSDPQMQEFCATAAGNGFSTGDFDDIKGWAVSMKGITPPDDMGASEKEGMTLLVTMINKAKTEKDLNAAGNKVDQDGQAQLSAFISYVQTNCE